MPRPITTALLYDERARDAANTRGENYWDAYLAEIAEEMGLPADPISPAVLRDPAALGRYSALLIGASAPEHLKGNIPTNLDRWVRDGGVLLGLGTEGLDDLFGVRERGRIEQPDGPFSIAATFRLAPHPLTADLGSPLQPDQRLLALSPVREVVPDGSAELARLFDLNGDDRAAAAITVRPHGRGTAFYTAFGLAQTMWILHKGHPLEGDTDGDNYLRVSDIIAIGDNSIRVQYADELLWLLQSVIATTGQPLLHQLPPKDGTVPDFLCFWGGDDEAATTGLQLRASNFLRARGLPYHINVMARDASANGGFGRFGLSVADCRAIQANGHELSLHYNFRDGFQHPRQFTREDVLAQAGAFKETYGITPICSVNHCGHWSGWYEPAEWYREVGGRADNSFIHHKSPPSNPVNRLGFSFGTAYPHYFYRDHRGGNGRIDFLEEPITSYEVGYFKDETDFPRLRETLDHAARYHLTLNTFYHPVYVSDFPACRRAIDETLRHIGERNYTVLHLGNDALWGWWDARHRSRLTDVRSDGSTILLTAHCEAPEGMVVKVPIDGDSATVQVDGEPSTCVTRRDFGRQWAYAVIPPGDHPVTMMALESGPR